MHPADSSVSGVHTCYSTTCTVHRHRTRSKSLLQCIGAASGETAKIRRLSSFAVVVGGELHAATYAPSSQRATNKRCRTFAKEGKEIGTGRGSFAESQFLRKTKKKRGNGCCHRAISDPPSVLPLTTPLIRYAS